MNRQPSSKAAIVFNATRQVFGAEYAVKPGSCCIGRRMIVKLEQQGQSTSETITLTARPLSPGLQGMAQIVRGSNGRMRGISTSLLKYQG